MYENVFKSDGYANMKWTAWGMGNERDRRAARYFVLRVQCYERIVQRFKLDRASACFSSKQVVVLFFCCVLGSQCASPFTETVVSHVIVWAHYFLALRI